jgi:hypothetical protein
VIARAAGCSHRAPQLKIRCPAHAHHEQQFGAYVGLTLAAEGTILGHPYQCLLLPVGSVLAGLPPERCSDARFGVQSSTRAIEARCKGVFEATTYISIGTKE